MTPSAQNAMLKTLEEPSGRTLIILLSDQPESMLPTIRSRCQTVRFSSISLKIVRRELEKRGIDGATAADAAELSDGSIGMALRWIEDGVISPAKELAARMDELFAGGDTGDLAGWLKSAADAYADKQLERDELASKDAAVRTGLAMYLALAGRRLRKHLAKADDPLSLDRACAAIDAMARAEMYLDANVNISVALQQFAVSLVG
jgi:DNA polymerase-3 subunit delta'